MIVHQETTTDGRTIFTPFECSYCQMNTAGDHDYNCPLHKEKKIYVSDPVEDYNDFTEVI